MHRVARLLLTGFGHAELGRAGQAIEELARRGSRHRRRSKRGPQHHSQHAAPRQQLPIGGGEPADILQCGAQIGLHRLQLTHLGLA
ncbi:MAG: hypothetical protein JF631_16090 [Mycobacterium sp.]|nr:hypothetical protein [Mycobacterium sp.]